MSIVFIITWVHPQNILPCTKMGIVVARLIWIQNQMARVRNKKIKCCFRINWGIMVGCVGTEIPIHKVDIFAACYSFEYILYVKCIRCMLNAYTYKKFCSFFFPQTCVRFKYMFTSDETFHFVEIHFRVNVEFFYVYPNE